MSEGDALWSNVLSFKYGYVKAAILDHSLPSSNSILSLWWRDLMLLLDSKANWFAKGISCKVGKGTKIDFWRASWLGPDSLRNQFPSLL